MYPGPATLIIVILIALAIQGLLQLDKRIEKQMEIERESHLLTNGEELSCNLDDQQAAGRFSQLLQFPSVSFKGEEEEEPTKLLVFRNMVQFLRSSYPTVFSAMEVKMLGGANLSMLLKWEGADSSLNPVLLVSHYDIVPVTSGTEDDWTRPPFSGHIDEDGFIWGRGSLDQKYSVASILEACARMIASGRKPVRGLYIAFGHDEETGGKRGAKMVGKWLAEQGVVLDVVIDEAGQIIEGGFPPFLEGHDLAMISTSEKSFTTMEVFISSHGGHSSMPPVDKSDIGSQTSRLLDTLPQFEATLRPPFTSFLRSLAPYTKFRLFRILGLIVEGLEIDESKKDSLHPLTRWIKTRLNRAIAYLFTFESKTAAMVRTTIAMTRLEAGVADNVLPQSGTLLFNLRSHPDDVGLTLIRNHFLSAISKSKVQGTIGRISRSDGCNVTTIAPSDGLYFKILARVIKEVWTEKSGKQIVIAPGLCTGETDSKHFAALSKEGVLRFTPVKMLLTDIKQVHGTDERTKVEYFYRAICFYRQMIERIIFQHDHN